VVSKLRGRAIYPKVTLALCCGARRGEILALREQDINLDPKIVTVRAALEETALQEAKDEGRRASDLTTPISPLTYYATIESSSSSNGLH
jgi:integrase